MTLLLSLVGEQPIPNLLPLWQFPEYDQVCFAATRVTLPVVQQMQSVAQSDPGLRHVHLLPPLQLPAYHWQEAQESIFDFLAERMEQGQMVEINLTGGTKLMSLAAMRAADVLSIPVLYVSTQTGEMIRIAPGTQAETRLPISVQISVAQYLAAHGFESSLHPNFREDLAPYSPPKEGDALEERVASLASRSGFFDDVQRGLFIRKMDDRLQVRNELDVLVTRNGRLAACSCKSGKNVNKDAIYELSSLFSRELAGIYCGKVLVIDQPELPKSLSERARLEKVRLVYGSKIDQIADVLLEAVQ